MMVDKEGGILMINNMVEGILIAMKETGKECLTAADLVNWRDVIVKAIQEDEGVSLYVE